MISRSPFSIILSGFGHCPVFLILAVISPAAVSGSPSFSKGMNSGSSLGSLGLDSGVAEPITGQ